MIKKIIICLFLLFLFEEHSITVQNKPLFSTQTETISFSNVAYYGASSDCDERITLIMPKSPGESYERLWDASRKVFIDGGTRKYIISGQGFDAKVRVKAKLSGATCTNDANRVNNYTKLFQKLSGSISSAEGNLPFKLTFSIPQLDPHVNYLFRYVESDPPISIDDSTDELVMDFKIDQAWHNTITLDTVYATNKPNTNYKQLGKRGYYFTDFEDCPTVNASGVPVDLNFFIKVLYDSEVGAGAEIGDRLVFRQTYSGSFYIIQQILKANSRSACLNPSINKLTNNFEYTLINLNNPFGANKFGKSDTDDDALADRYYFNFKAYAPPADFDDIFTNDFGGIEIDFANDDGISNLRNLKEWSNESSSNIKMGECTADFESAINPAVTNGNPC